MKLILTFVLVALLQTQSTAAYPVNSSSIPNKVSNACGNTYAYCCNERSTSSPHIVEIYEDLNGVIDILKGTCTNKTILANVRVAILCKLIYSLLYIAPN